MEKIYFIKQNFNGDFDLEKINKKIKENFFSVKLVQSHTARNHYENGVFIVLDGGSSELSENL